MFRNLPTLYWTLALQNWSEHDYPKKFDPQMQTNQDAKPSRPNLD